MSWGDESAALRARYYEQERERRWRERAEAAARHFRNAYVVDPHLYRLVA